MGCLFLKIWKARSDEKQLVSQFTISQTTKIALTGAVDILSALPIQLSIFISSFSSLNSHPITLDTYKYS